MTPMNLRAIGASLACALLICTSGLAGHLPRTQTAAQPATANQQGTIDLRPRFEKGQQTRYTLEMKNTSWGATTLRAPGQRGQPPANRQPPTPDARSTVEFGLLLRTTDVSDGIATVDMVLETVKLRVEAQEMEIEFDSTAPAGKHDDMMAALFQSIVGSTMTLKVDRDGNIKSISGGESLAALGQVGIPGAGGGQLFGNIFTVKGAAGMVSVGESWETESRVDSGLLSRFNMKTRYTLSRMQGKDAIITMRGRYELDSESGGGGHVTIKESSYSGNYTWDTGSGSLKQMDSSMTTVAESGIGDDKVETRNESVVKVTRQR